ncbi:hypothetical protein ACOMHN_051795 [Nucella lapillus]
MTPGDVVTRTSGDLNTRTSGDVATRAVRDVATRAVRDVATRLLEMWPQGLLEMQTWVEVDWRMIPGSMLSGMGGRRHDGTVHVHMAAGQTRRIHTHRSINMHL